MFKHVFNFAANNQTAFYTKEAFFLGIIIIVYNNNGNENSPI